MELLSKKNVETNRYELELAVSPEEFEKALESAYRRERGRMNVPGFRKGKAPRPLLEKMYGEEVFFETAVNSLSRQMMLEAVEQSELKVVTVADIQVSEISKKDGVKAVVTVVTRPEAAITDYKGIEIQKEPVVATEGDVDREIENVRERNSRIVTVEDRAAEDGDIVDIDFEGFTDGVPFDGGKGENFELTLGSGQFIPGFEEKVVGHKAGEEFDIDVTFPEDYSAEELKGKPAVFKIKIHEIKKKELPEVDDEFVKDVSEFDTLAEYRDSLKQEILDRREKAAESDIENRLLDAVVEKVQAEIPPEMVENEIDEMINSFAYRLQSQGLNLETYLKYTGMSTDDLRKQYEEPAKRQVRLRLGLEKIAELEGITPTAEETEAEYQRLADEYGMPLDDVKNVIREEDLNQDISNRKTVDFLKENAVITEAEKDETPAEDKPADKPAKKKTSSRKKAAEKAAQENEEEKGEKEDAEA